MTRRRKPLVAHLVLMSFVLDTALAGRVAATPVKPGAVYPHVLVPMAPASGAPAVRPARVAQAVRMSAPPAAPFSRPSRVRPPPRIPRLTAMPPPTRIAPPTPAAQIEECENALTDGRAPATTVSRTLLWPPDGALIDVGLAVRSTPVCEGLLELTAQVWSDDGSTTGDARFEVPDLYLRSERERRMAMAASISSSPTPGPTAT